MFANIVFEKPLLQKTKHGKKTSKNLQNEKVFENLLKVISTLVTTSLMKKKSLK
jgi:hypothetical protein